MALVSLRDVSIGFQGPTLLDHVSAQVEVGDRIGLLGRNGAGKTTLMRLLAGEFEPDDGRVQFSPGMKVARLVQDVPRDLNGPVADVVALGLHHELHAAHDNAWQGTLEVQKILSRMELDGAALFESLSSGMKRRVLLAQALVAAPDLLLLDEPTNHLDLEAIDWLEDFLRRWTGTLMFVTHDRMFLRRLAQRILEIDRGRLFDWSCDYDAFLERKEQALAAEEKQDALFDKRLAQEEVWIRTGIKARRTRNEGRVRALEQMRRVRQQRRSAPGKAKLEIQEAQKSGMLVAAIEDMSFSFGERPIVQNFSTTIFRGDKIGIIGPNGVGKTTLIKLLLGQLEPQAGTVRLGTNLQVAYFDQLRQQLPDETTPAETIGEGNDHVRLQGGMRHVMGYLQDFLFTPERARTPIKFLSGGERNRLLLAKLFSKPANVLVMDEPTNDLDIETMELLESRLVEFDGTLLLVSHDRAFLNDVVTSTLVFENGQLREYVGGYDEWLRQRPATKPAEPAASATSPKNEKSSAAAADSSSTATKPAKETRKRLSFKEQQELAALPEKIHQLEADIAALHESMGQADFYRRTSDEIAREKTRLTTLESDLQTAYERWESLESK